MADELPWFPFYASRFESDEAVRMMTFEQQGIYLRLMCWQWREGSIPADQARLERGLSSMSPKPVSRDALQQVVAECFEGHPRVDDRLINLTLHEIREEQRLKSLKLRKAGREGGHRSAQARLKRASTEGEGESLQGSLLPTDGSPKGKTKTQVPAQKPAPKIRVTWLTPYDDLWRSRFKVVIPFGAAAKSLKPLETQHSPEAVLRALGNYLDAHTGSRASYVSLPKFASTFGQWLEPNGAKTSAGERTLQNLKDL